MDINKFDEFFKNADDYTHDQIKRFVNQLIREKNQFKNLKGNEDVILDIINSQRDKLRRGIGISEDNIRNKMHDLYQRRIVLGLTDEDLADIKEILHYFKK